MRAQGAPLRIQYPVFMNLKSIALVCALASLVAPFSVRAGDVAAKTAQSDAAAHSGGFPELQTLTPEEQAKFKAATLAAKKDPKVEAARERMSAAIQAFRASLEAAMVASDPTLEPILKKLKEARERDLANGAGTRAPQ
jgi:hypothetical protein